MLTSLYSVSGANLSGLYRSIDNIIWHDIGSSLSLSVYTEENILEYIYHQNEFYAARLNLSLKKYIAIDLCRHALEVLYVRSAKVSPNGFTCENEPNGHIKYFISHVYKSKSVYSIGHVKF